MLMKDLEYTDEKNLTTEHSTSNYNMRNNRKNPAVLVLLYE